MLTMHDFRAIQQAYGARTEQDAIINEAKASLRHELVTSVHYIIGKRNGIEQGFVVTPSEAYHKYEIEALPDEPLYVGDEIECFNEHWIVVKTRVASPFQTIGLMWLCNYKFRWQNHTPDIVERWGVLDSGVYSTTRDGNGDLVTPDKQFKIYFPKDPDTQKLYIDKRLAVEIIYDAKGEEIMNVYRITGYDAVSSSYGQNGHLLVLNARSDDYVAERDSKEEMICDFIEHEDPPVGEGTITGPTVLRLGATRNYTTDVPDAEWHIAPALEGITLTTMNDACTLAVTKSEDLVGEEFVLYAENLSGYSAALKVEVIQ